MFSVLRYRGDHIVPNFEEIWPSGKPRRQRRGAPSAPTKGIAYIEHAMATGILGEKDKDFTTVGKPKVNNPENYTPSNIMIILQRARCGLQMCRCCNRLIPHS